MKSKILHLVGVLGFSLSFQNCNLENPEESQEPRSEEVLLEEAFPGKRGVVKEGWYRGMPITYEEIEGKAVIQGDIALDLRKLDKGPPVLGKTASTARFTGTWDNNLVYYTIDPALPNQARVTSAIAHWESQTYLRFIKWENHPGRGYVTFRPHTDAGACLSDEYGRAQDGSQQFISIGSNCSTGNTIHEIGHAVGFFHEQCHSDRDNYITIHWDRILAGRAPLFYTWNDPRHEAIYGVPTWDGFNHGPVDVGSIMMYASNAFSKNGLPTMTTPTGGTWTAQRNGLSSGDRLGAMVKYPMMWTRLVDMDPYVGRDLGAGGGVVRMTGGPAVGNDFGVYRWHGFWLREDMDGMRIDGDRDGMAWVVKNDGRLFHGSGSQWTDRSAGLTFTDVTAGADGSVWAIGKTAVSGGFRIYQWNGSGWTLKPGGATRISVGADGRPWVTNSSYNIYRWNGTGWTGMPGTGRDVGVGVDNTVWALSNVTTGNGYVINVWNGSAWRTVTGGGLNIDVDNFGNPWTVTNTFEVYN